MFPGGPNPSKIQSATGGSLAPLVLIHDGGGTTFSYFFLGNLNRDVWVIHNPHYWSGEKVEGGIDAMAKSYITLIRNAGLRGKIFLGGASAASPQPPLCHNGLRTRFPSIHAMSSCRI
jgi:pimeloyl-ACP methyl ester carboxylesterase